MRKLTHIIQMLPLLLIPLPIFLLLLFFFLLSLNQGSGGSAPITQAPVLTLVYDLTGVHLSWTSVTGATQYVLEVNGVDIAPVTGLTQNFPSLVPNLYTFRVRGFRPAATYGPYSNSVTADVREIFLQVTYTGSGTTYDLTWSDSSSVGDFYSIYVKTGPGIQPWVFLASVPFGTNTYQTVLPYLTLKTFRVDRNTPYMNSNGVSVTHMPTDPPDIPSLYAVPDMLDPNTAVALTWLPGTGYVDTWELEVSPDGMAWAPLQTFPAVVTSYTHVGLTLNTTYYYQIRGVNGVGPGPWVAANVTTTNGIPRTPILLSVTHITSYLPIGAVQVEWLDEAGDEDAYLLYRKDVNLPDPPVIVATFAPTAGVGSTVSELDTNGLYTGTFQYFVVAQSMANGNSYQSNTLQVTLTGVRPYLDGLAAVPALNDPQTMITASWFPVRGADQLRIDVYDVNTSVEVYGPAYPAINDINHIITGLTPATEYQITLTSVNNVESTFLQQTVFMQTLPPSTAGLQVEMITGSAAAMLFWTDLPGSQETLVQIYRRPQFGSFIMIATLSLNNNVAGPPLVRFFIDPNTLSGQNYDYKVVYINPLPYANEETNTVSFSAPLLSNVGPALLQAFNSKRFTDYLPPTFNVDNTIVSYYLASFFNTSQLTLNEVNVIADVVGTPNTGAGFFFSHVIEYCTRASFIDPWEVSAVLATKGAFVSPNTNTVPRVGFATTPITPLLQGSSTNGYLVSFPLAVPLVIPPTTQFCIRIKIKSYENLGLGPIATFQPTDSTSIIRVFNVDPSNGFTGSARNLGPFLASTGGEMGLIPDLPGPVTPISGANSMVPQIFMKFTSP